MSDNIKMLVIGCGSIGMRHLRILAERKDVEVAAFDSRIELSREVAGLGGDIRFFSSLDAALDWEPKIAVVAAPNEVHCELTLRCFAAGVHVLCEKPLADTIDNGCRMVEAARDSGMRLAVGYSERYRPSVQYMEELVKSGSMGNLIGGRAMVGTYNTLLCAKTDARSRIFGSLIIDYTHELDLMRLFFGDVEDVICKANKPGKKDIGADPSLAAMLLVFKGGAVVSVHMDYVQHPQRRCLELYGDVQTAELDMQTDFIRLYDCNRPGYRVQAFDPVRDDRFRAEHQDIIDAVTDGTPPRVTGEDGLRVLEIAERAISQIRNGLG
ncbi:MAG: Gfo/Idh/MocA family oxidoreductase [bacterium]|nr:Gfo/Idh/MocA family oxidoreductase [bacterium]